MMTKAHGVSLLGAGALAVLGVGCSAEPTPARLHQEPASAAAALVWAEAGGALLQGGEIVGTGIVCAATCAEDNHSCSECSSTAEKFTGRCSKGCCNCSQ